MAKVNISDAIKMSGVSRQTFYAKYINKGVVTVEKDHLGKKCIDTAELMRVFGNIALDNEDKTIHDDNRRTLTPDLDSKIRELEMEVKLVREQLADHKEQIQDYRQREQRLLDQVDNLAGTLKQIEHRPEPPELPAESRPAKRGLWARILGR